MKTSKDEILQMMQEEFNNMQEETPVSDITRSEIKKMMEEEASRIREIHGGEHADDDMLWEQLEDLVAEIMNHSGDHGAVDKAEAAYKIIEKLRGTDSSGGWGSEGVSEARKRPLKRDREAFARNQDMVSGLQKTITNYLKETGAKLSGRHKEVIETMSTRLMHVANSPMIRLEEGNEVSSLITRLEQIGKEVQSANVKSSDPDTIARLDRIDSMISSLFEDMHNLL